jgi:ribosome-associated protein
MPPEPDAPLRVTPALTIPAAELTWRFTASGGPGGQHANTANTRVELVYDLAASEVLSDAQRARLRSKLGDEVRVVVSDQRSQARNRAIARERLRDALVDALKVPRRRIPTRPSRAAAARRLDAKQQRSQLKRLRGRIEPPA